MLFVEVAAVIVWRHNLKRHVGGLDFGTIEGEDFIVEDLVFRFDALAFHAREGALMRHNYFFLSFSFIGSTVAVDVVGQHLILAATDGA